MSDDSPNPDNQATLRNISMLVHPSHGISQENVDFILDVIQPIVLPNP